MQGILKALSIHRYGLFDNENLLQEFVVEDGEIRQKLDPMQGSEVDFDEDILPLLNRSEGDESQPEPEKDPEEE